MEEEANGLIRNEGHTTIKFHVLSLERVGKLIMGGNGDETNLIMVVISQYIHVSNHHFAYLTPTYFTRQ